MKSILVHILITVIFLTVSCSESTAPDDVPPLGDFLYGKYVDVQALWSEYPEPGQSHNVESTDSTKLILNSNGEYTMKLELYIEYLDTTLNLLQHGTFITKETEYIDTNEPLTFSTWKGTLVFSPIEDSAWSAKFSIPSSTKDLFFDHWSSLELPDSTGWFKVFSWYRKKRL